VAIAWLLAKPYVTSVILGATKLRQLADNLGSADVALTPEDVAELDAATALGPAYPNWFIDEMADGAVRDALAGVASAAS
jgi:diketogulonate reductase-like aldo/keto reductase